MRPFAPTSFGINTRELVAGLTEWRLGHSGEYVLHLPAGSDPQWVVLNYQHIPIDASLTPDYALAGTNPRAWGLADHFAVQPLNYKAGNSIHPATGSQFEIRGFLFNVKGVKINHRSGLHLELEPADSCAEARPEFFTEQADLLCPDVRPCA